MAFDKSDMLGFINALRETDDYLVHIYSYGSCYQFHLFLAKVFDGCEPYINQEKSHIITKFEGSFYDISGLVNERGFHPATSDDLELAGQWSFYANNMLRLTDCEHCDEPIVYKQQVIYVEESDVSFIKTKNDER